MVSISKTLSFCTSGELTKLTLMIKICRNGIGTAHGIDGKPIAPVGILEEYMWEVLFRFHPLVAQAKFYL
ncbi:hypothetical protein E2C01_048207 [Portunus trituberculatus]|uniref:Uncharacterized protein n=1 Tax=Portunus trituberculatus TaxID=210409 RepID=A0A5B7G9Z9_PORTR|nr:hypothetical protein [Portunus trituberculatus]